MAKCKSSKCVSTKDSSSCSSASVDFAYELAPKTSKACKSEKCK